MQRQSLHPISSQMFSLQGMSILVPFSQPCFYFWALCYMVQNIPLSAYASCAGCVTSHLLAHFQPSCLLGRNEKQRGPWWWASTALYCLLAIAKMLVVISALLVTSLKQKTTQAAMKKINAVILRKKIWKSLSTIYWIWAVVGCFKNA